MSQILTGLSALEIHPVECSSKYHTSECDTTDIIESPSNCLGCKITYCSLKCKASDAPNHLNGRQDATDESKSPSQCEMIFR